MFGNLNGSEYSDDDGKKFAVAYFREDLKAMDCNPDIFAQQKENKDNPHKKRRAKAIRELERRGIKIAWVKKSEDSII